MSRHIFEGRQFAQEKELILVVKVNESRRKGVTPKLVSVVLGDEEGALAYQRLKQKAAERVGCDLAIVDLSKTSSVEQIIEVIEKSNSDPKTHGVMLQLPLPAKFADVRQKMIDAIVPEKDIDGMTDSAHFFAPVVLAVEATLHQSSTINRQSLIAIVGANGFVGKKIMKRLGDLGYKVTGADVETAELKAKTENADAVISATGIPGLIKPDMVKEGVVLIDVGAPVGDVDKATYEKASFVTPVPGGIGPVTIFYLIDNLVKAATTP